MAGCSISVRKKSFVFDIMFTPAFGSTQTPTQSVPGSPNPEGQSDRSVKLTTLLRLMPRLRIRAAAPKYLEVVVLWHRDKYILPYTFYDDSNDMKG
jgi:hypothetical protein